MVKCVMGRRRVKEKQKELNRIKEMIHSRRARAYFNDDLVNH